MTTKVAFLFPGQGSQAVGMGADIFAASPAAKQVFEAVDDAIGTPLSRLCFQGPEETLRETINAQPAIVTVSLAILAAFQEALSLPATHIPSWSLPLVPSYTAGHSVGEYSALVASGALDLKLAALLVRERGRLMHQEGTACPGGMAAVIGMDEQQLQAVCRDATQQAQQEIANEPSKSTASTHPGLGQVAVANYNAPGQIVISGEQKALALASEIAKSRGAKRVIPLSVSGAFHSPVMQPASVGLAHAVDVAIVNDVIIPVIGNSTGTPLLTEQDIRQELTQQIASSVQWVRTIEYMVNAGVTVFIEIGPGQTLTGMVKRIAKGVTTITISTNAEIEKAVSLVREMGLVHSV
ncbi:MAG: ACP S-malonyltransferase [Ktedonobacteraceae bacterium]